MIGTAIKFWGEKNLFDAVIDSAGVALATQAAMGSLASFGDKEWNVQRLGSELERRFAFLEVAFAVSGLSMLKTVEVVAMLVVGILSQVRGVKDPFALAKRAIIELVATVYVSWAIGWLGFVNPIWGTKAYLFMAIGLAKQGKEYWPQYAKGADNMTAGVEVVLVGQPKAKEIGAVFQANNQLVRTVFSKVFECLSGADLAVNQDALKDEAARLTGDITKALQDLSAQKK